MKAKRKPLVIKEIRYADSDDASRRKITEVYRLLLHPPAKDALESKRGQENLNEREEPPTG